MNITLSRESHNCFVTDNQLNKIRLVLLIKVCVTIELISACVRFYFIPDMPLVWHGLVGLLTAAFLTIYILLIHGIDLFLNQYFSYDQGIGKRVMLQLFVSLVFLYTIVLTTFPYILPLFPKDIQANALPFMLVIDTLMVFLMNGIYFGAYFFYNWRQSQIKTERLQREGAQVRFDTLKNQLNPHFLFNSLASLNSLIFENQELASMFLQHMSRVYRYVLHSKDKEMVSLQSEIEFIQNYIYLLQTRHAGSLEITVDIPKDKFDAQIVPVTLQIMIENAIKHNSTTIESPLKIRIYCEGETLVVSYNLQRRARIDHSNNMGLANLKALYSYLTTTPVTVRENDQEFAVMIPLL